MTGRTQALFSVAFPIRMRRLTAIVAVCSFFVGCYAYTPIPLAQSTTSAAVRLTLTAPFYAERFGSLGSNVRALEGKVRLVDESSVTIAVTDVARTTEDEEQFHGETVTIPRQAIAGIDQRHVSIARSLLLTGLIIGGAIWIGSQGHGDVAQIRTKGPSTGQ